MSTTWSCLHVRYLQTFWKDHRDTGSIGITPYQTLVLHCTTSCWDGVGSVIDLHRGDLTACHNLLSGLL
jgi:hypothetical protein